MPPALPQSATGLAPLFGHSPENEKGETAVRIPVYTTRSLLLLPDTTTAIQTTTTTTTLLTQ